MSIHTDDHDAFDRPRKRSRPRTKDRPDYSKLPLGRVISIDRGRYRCLLDGRLVTAVRGRLIDRKGIIVGDIVRLDGDTSGAEGTLARAVENVGNVGVGKVAHLERNALVSAVARQRIELCARHVLNADARGVEVIDQTR